METEIDLVSDFVNEVVYRMNNIDGEVYSFTSELFYEVIFGFIYDSTLNSAGLFAFEMEETFSCFLCWFVVRNYDDWRFEKDYAKRLAKKRTNKIFVQGSTNEIMGTICGGTEYDLLNILHNIGLIQKTPHLTLFGWYDYKRLYAGDVSNGLKTLKNVCSFAPAFLKYQEEMYKALGVYEFDKALGIYLLNCGVLAPFLEDTRL